MRTTAVPHPAGPLLDLRSDTLTKPTPALRMAMMAAEVGDAYYDEDPSVLALEERVAQVLGFEAAAFMPSGTMSNQVALRFHARAGDAVLCSPENHIVQYETGALAGINGLQHMPAPLESNGFRIDEAALAGCIVPADARHAPTTSVVAVENTQLRAGGAVYPLEALVSLRRACNALGLPLHIDGARLWHAAHVETHARQGNTQQKHLQNVSPFAYLARYGDACDTLSVCFSKGLGAPVGSAMLGPRRAINAAKKIRKMMGGTMRQCGILAAGAQFAMENQFERLADDHASARILARAFAETFPHAIVPVPATNIVLARFSTPTEALACVEKFHSEKNVRLSLLDPVTVRGVTHLDAPLSAFQERFAPLP